MDTLPSPPSPPVPPIPAPVTETPEESKPLVWGPWATAGLALAVLVIFVVGQMIPIVAGSFLHSWWDPQGAGKLESMPTDGDVLSASTIVGGMLAFGSVALLAAIRSGSPGRYLKLRSFAWWQMPVWLAVAGVAGYAQTVLAPWFHQEAIPQFMVDMFRSTDHPALLIVGIAFAAPFFEETFFRGFLHEGWRQSRFGPLPSVFLTSLLWTLIHVQYGWFELSWIFCFGLLLGWAREASGSLWIPISMHVMNNGLSLIATAMELQ